MHVDVQVKHVLAVQASLSHKNVNYIGCISRFRQLGQYIVDLAEGSLGEINLLYVALELVQEGALAKRFGDGRGGGGEFRGFF